MPKKPFYKNGMIVGLIIALSSFVIMFISSYAAAVALLLGGFVFVVSLIRFLVRLIKNKIRAYRTTKPGVTPVTLSEHGNSASIVQQQSAQFIIEDNQSTQQSPTPQATAQPLQPQTHSKPVIIQPTKTITVRRKTENHKVTGISHYQDNIEFIGVDNTDYMMSREELRDAYDYGTKVYEYEFISPIAQLEPEPDNPYDSNAIKVIIDGRQVGYIKKGSCSHILKLINNDQITGIDAVVGGGRYKVLYNYGDSIEDEEFESEQTPYFVGLTLHIIEL